MQNKETKENYLVLAADYPGKVGNRDADSRKAYSGLNVFAAGTPVRKAWDRTLKPGSIVIEGIAGSQ